MSSSNSTTRASRKASARLSTPQARTASALLAALALWAAAGLALADGDRLVFLDGTAASDTVAAIDAKGLVDRGQGKPPVDLQGLRRIERPVKPDAPKPVPCSIHLLGGGLLQAQGVACAGERFTIRWAYGDKLELPLAAVRAVRLGKLPDAKDDALAPPFEAAVAATEAARDELFAIVDGKLQAARGGLVRIEPKEVVFQWGDAERKVARDKVYGIALAHPGATADLSGCCLIRLKDGSSLWAAVTKLEGGKLLVRPVGGGEASLPWDAVCRLDVRSTRMAFLSDLDPVEVAQEALATYPGPWRRDLNVVGGPLQLGKSLYEKGLGVHARCRLVYDLGGRYDTFAATIGLDASTGGQGDCVFRVEADDRELVAKRLRGGDAPVPLRLKIAGAQRLALTVEWGEDLDLADRADWCDARVLKQGDHP